MDIRTTHSEALVTLIGRRVTTQTTNLNLTYIHAYIHTTYTVMLCNYTPPHSLLHAKLASTVAMRQNAQSQCPIECACVGMYGMACGMIGFGVFGTAFESTACQIRYSYPINQSIRP